MKHKRGTKLLGILLSLVMVLGLMSGMSLTAYAETYDSNVDKLQAGDILEPGAGFYANGKTITLLANGYATAEGYGDNATYTQGTTDVSYMGSGNLRVSSESNWLGAIEAEIDHNSVYYYPYVNGAKAEAWQVVAVEGDEWEMTAVTLTGYAETQSDNPFTSTVYYRQYNTSGVQQENGTLEANAGILIESDTKKWADGNTYVASGSVTISSRVKVTGTVNLILLDGASLTINGGIAVKPGNTLNIYAGNTTSSISGSGVLTAAAGRWNAGIGSGESDWGETTATVNIHGGSITATGGDNGAGIGGEYCRVVNIYDGSVTANGGGDGAGIGGGYNDPGGTVTIYGGTVTATGGESGAGIGGGKFGSGGTVRIYGGTVTATGGAKPDWGSYSDSTGIGRGCNDDGSENNGTLTLGEGVGILVSDDNSTWTAYDGSTRARYMKTGEAAPALDPVASVTPSGGAATNYTDFAEAVTAWNTAGAGATLKLLADVETNSSVTINAAANTSPLILDLNGYGIRYTGTGGSVIDLNEDRTLKLTDSAASARTHYITLDENGRGVNVADSGTESATCVKVTGGYLTGGTGKTGVSISGGGVYDLGSFTMEGGTIVGNTASQGGGVFVCIIKTFTMTGGTITGNKASTNGGGVCVGGAGTFNLSGGTITGNSASTAGGGVYVNGGCTFNLSGGAIITGNLKGSEANNAELSNGRKITLTGALDSAASIGVTMATPGVFTEGGKAKDYAAKFTSDNTAYSVMAEGGELKLSSHIHSFNYTASGASITATCGEGCDITTGLTLTISAPSDLIYNGSPKPATLNSDYSTEAFGTPVISYKKGGESISGAPTDVGEYTASVTVGDATASVSFTIGAATPVADDFDFTAPASLTYDGEAKEATVTSDKTGMGDITVHYYSDAERTAANEVDASDVKSAGTYYVGITTVAGDNYAAATTPLFADGWSFTIGAATPVADDFDFTAPASLTYDNTAKSATVTAKTGVDGMGEVTVHYYSDAARTTEVTATDVVNAGTYYVGVTTGEGSNYAAATQRIYADAWSFTITKAPITVYGNITPWKYGAYNAQTNAPGVTDDSNPGNAAVTYDYAACVTGVENDALTYRSGLPTAVGDYVLRAQVAESDNYQAGTGYANFSIYKGDQSAPAAPTKASATINSVTLDTVAGCEYSRDGTNWQDSPTFTGLSMNTEYTFYQRLKETDNYYASPKSSVANLSTNDHVHDWGYTAGTGENANTITATCGNTDGGHSGSATATLIISAPTGDLTYDGETTFFATYSRSSTTAFPGTYTITYTKDGAAFTGEPVAAGAYVASVTVGDATASVSFTIAKADSTAATVTGNTVKINEAAKPLVTVTGEATGGTMQYALGSATEAQNEFTADIPTTDDIGAVGTYYVWYKVKGDANHNDTAPACATATVTEDAQTLYTLTYDPNGGTGEMADESYESGATVTVKNNTFTAPKDKGFDGWNTAADGSGTAYKPGDSFVISANTTLYARWSAVTAEVDFKPDAGSGSAVQNVESDTEVLKELVKDVPAGSTVDVKLLAKASEDLTKMPDSELDEQQKAVKAAQSSITITANETDGVQNLEFLDLSILKTVDGSQSYITETGETVLAIKISYNTANKTDFAVYRQHDGKTESFTRLFAEPTGNFKDATFFVGDGYIMIYSSRFSTYAIGYNVQTYTFDLYTGSADHKDVEVSLGGMSVYSVSADTEGDPAVTLNDYSVEADTLVLKSAYLSRLAVGMHEFSVYTVENDTNPLAVTVEVVDTTPAASFVTISEPHYHIILAETVNGTAKVSRTTAPKGATVTVTATPDEGYVLDAITAKDAKGNDVEVKDGKFTMPAADVTVTVTFAAEGCPGGDACPLSAFTDLDPDAWYHDGIHFVLESGLMQGYGNGLFGPDDATTRAMVVTMLYRMEGEPVIRSGMPFSDVTESDWYAKAVSWAESQGIVKGFEDGTFRPNDPITREQLATMLYRYAQYKGEGFQGLWSFKLDFPDAGDVSDWASEAMHWCVMQGIIKGMDGALNPQGDATRAQLAAMVQRFCANIAE